MNLLLQWLVYRFYAMPQTFCRGARGETPRLAHQAERLLVGDCITFAAASRPLGTHRRIANTHTVFRVGSYGDDGAGAGGGLAGRWLPW
jgi:hypothetical protein